MILSAESGREVTVPFAVDGDSTATGGGVDYSLSSSPLIFPAGTTQKTITLTVVADSIDDPDETVILDLTPPTHATTGSPSRHTATFGTDAMLDPPVVVLENAPRTPVSDPELKLVVGGVGVVSYVYRIDGGSWSDETPVATRLDMPLGGEGDFLLEVRGKANPGIWQDETAATQLTVRVDRTAPTALLSGAPSGTIGRRDAVIHVRGEGLLTYRYRLNTGSWSPVRKADIPISLENLSEAEHELSVIGCDAAGNWQNESASTDANWTVNLAQPTAILSGTPDLITRETGFSIHVSEAHGTPAAYSWSLDGGSWTEVTTGTPIVQSGLADGSHILRVNALKEGLWQGGSDGTTEMGATTWTWTVDTTPPSPFTVTATSGTPPTSIILLDWPAASDATTYRLWMSDTPLDASSFATGTRLFFGKNAILNGNRIRYAVEGLKPDTDYWFAVRAEDISGNASVPTIISEKTASNLPSISAMAFSGGGISADNGSLQTLTLQGAHFLEAKGANLVRFASLDTLFDVRSRRGVSTNEFEVEIPKGAPGGSYAVRVINRHGTSKAAAQRILLTEATTPLPAVTGVQPRVVSAASETVLAITGRNFPSGITNVWLVADPEDPPSDWTGLLSVNRESDTRLTGSVPSGTASGCHEIRVETSGGEINNISSAEVEVLPPVDITSTQGSFTTLLPIRIPTGMEMLPSETILTTDDREEAPHVSVMAPRIAVTFEAGTMLEEQEEDGVNYRDYHDMIRPPRQIPILPEVNARMESDAVLFSLGADHLLRLKDEDPDDGIARLLHAEITVTLSSTEPLPKVYHVAPDTTLTLAGVNGARDGQTYEKGGTLLTTRPETPEAGYTTYTIGLLMNHMSNYVVGTKADSGTPSGSSYDPCFIGNLEECRGMWRGLFIALLMAFGIAGRKYRRR